MSHVRMLRASAIAFGYDIDLAVVADPSPPLTIPGGAALLRFVDVLLGLDDTPLDEVHRLIIDELGPAALVDAASVFGNFQMMNRVAEGTGIPIPQQAIDRERALVERLGLLELVKPAVAEPH